MNPENTGGQSRSRKILWLLLWTAFGAAVGYFGAKLFLADVDRGSLIDVDISTGLALLVSVIFALCSLILAVGTLVPAAGISMKMFDDHEQWMEEREMMWLSVFGCLAYAGLLAMLAFAGRIGLADRPALLVAMGLLVFLTIGASWRLFAIYDELWREVTAEMAAFGYYILFAVGGVWSGLAHLGYVQPLEPLDWLTLFTVSTLIAAFIATYRRGMMDD